MTDVDVRSHPLYGLLKAPSTLHDPNYTSESDEVFGLLRDVPVLVIGAGGLGCEFLKNLAILGMRKITVIDLDTIDLSNLNRQFMFSTEDLGKPKAVVAAAFVQRHFPECQVDAKHSSIEAFGPEFYSQFQIILCGLDSIGARRWLNSMICSLLTYNESGELDPASIIPIIDGGTEGLKGNVRVVIPGVTACVECTMDLYPPQVNYPLCTIASSPRLPEHCIEFVRIIKWEKEWPFGEDIGVDGDDPRHLQWIFERALDRAKSFNISGVTYRLTQGVVKRIIPAVASTNAAIAGLCCTEVVKLLTGLYKGATLLDFAEAFMNFNQIEGVYGYAFPTERNENCPACSNKPAPLSIPQTAKVADVIETVKQKYDLKNPSLTSNLADGSCITLFVPLIEATKANLERQLYADFGLRNGSYIAVADSRLPKTLSFTLTFVQSS